MNSNRKYVSAVKRNEKPWTQICVWKYRSVVCVWRPRKKCIMETCWKLERIQNMLRKFETLSVCSWGDGSAEMMLFNHRKWDYIRIPSTQNWSRDESKFKNKQILSIHLMTSPLPPIFGLSSTFSVLFFFVPPSTPTKVAKKDFRRRGATWSKIPTNDVRLQHQEWASIQRIRHFKRWWNNF